MQLLYNVAKILTFDSLIYVEKKAVFSPLLGKHIKVSTT